MTSSRATPWIVYDFGGNAIVSRKPVGDKPPEPTRRRYRRPRPAGRFSWIFPIASPIPEVTNKNFRKRTLGKTVARRTGPAPFPRSWTKPRDCIMSASRRLGIALGFVVILVGGGCVGPMACGPAGCDSHALVTLRHSPACVDCGERYIDPWVNHPADACDPCDACGNHQGQTCGHCRPIFSGFRSLWGYRKDPPPSGCHLHGCDTCADGFHVDTGYLHAQPMPPGRAAFPSVGPPGPDRGVPTPAPEAPAPEPLWDALEADDDAVSEDPDQAHSMPRRTRQIFRSRGGTAATASQIRRN